MEELHRFKRERTEGYQAKQRAKGREQEEKESTKEREEKSSQLSDLGQADVGCQGERGPAGRGPPPPDRTASSTSREGSK